MIVVDDAIDLVSDLVQPALDLEYTAATSADVRIAMRSN